MQPGDMVRMRVYGGESVLVVVQLTDTHANVCTPEEYEKAKREGREPILVGFPITDIIEEGVAVKSQK